jgi:DNA-binding CsgD family transcriptional regulator
VVSHSPNVDDLILRIHSAALAKNGWDIVVSDLCHAFKATGASLVRPTANASIKPSATLYEFDAAAIKQYTEHWGQHDVWYIGALRRGRIDIGQVNLDSQLIDRREFERSEFFNDYLRPINIDRMMNVCLAAPNGGYGPVAMSFYRGLGKEQFSPEEARLFSHLSRHLTVAAQNYWTAQSLRLMGDAYRNAVDAVTSAVFGITAGGKVAFMNSAGEELLRQRRWVQVSNGALGALEVTVEADALSQALRQLSIGISFKMIVTEAVAMAQAIVSGAPISRVESSPYPISASALVWLTPVVPNVDVAADLAMLFGLTLAEKRLVGRLIAGDELRDAAANLRISLHTARTQLKAIFGKTGRRSQAALLTFAARLATLRTTPSERT